MSSQNEPEYKNPYKVSSRHDSMRKSGVGIALQAFRATRDD